MRFWFEHSGDVSLREQVVTQVTLGVLCGELAPGERLPSIRELARRFGLHANTVSAGYRQLEAEGWVESRRGSGVYVREARPGNGKAARGDGLERLVENLFAGARRLGVPREEVLRRVQHWSEGVAPSRVVLVEPDAELRRIVLAELGGDVEGRAELPETLEGVLLLALPSKVDGLKAKAEGRARVLGLRLRAVTGTMAAYLPQDVTTRADALVGIVSGWGEFRRFARTMLVASGFSGEALMVRDTADARWADGLASAAAVVCDAHAAAELAGMKTVIIRLLDDGVTEEVRGLVDNRAT